MVKKLDKWCDIIWLVCLGILGVIRCFFTHTQLEQLDTRRKGRRFPCGHHAAPCIGRMEMPGRPALYL